MTSSGVMVLYTAVHSKYMGDFYSLSKKNTDFSSNNSSRQMFTFCHDWLVFMTWSATILCNTVCVVEASASCCSVFFCSSVAVRASPPPAVFVTRPCEWHELWACTKVQCSLLLRRSLLLPANIDMFVLVNARWYEKVCMNWSCPLNSSCDAAR